MDPEHARLSTGVDEFWDDDDNTSVDFTPRWAHADTIELVGAPGPSSGLDTNWWDGDGQDALWDAAESDPPAHAPLRAVNAADTGAWSPVLEPRPPWYRTRPGRDRPPRRSRRLRPHNRRPGGRQPRRGRAGPAQHHA